MEPIVENLDFVSGIVERITFHNEENGWSVLKVSTLKDHGQLVTVVIHQAKVFAGATMDFWGNWTKHPKHGNQFKAVKALEKKPATTAALEKYLGSGLIKGVGPSTAQRIVSHFKEDTLAVFESRINELMHVPGIAEKKLVQIRNSWDEHRSIRDVMIFLQGYGVSTLFATKIYKTYGEKAIAVVSANPYRLATDIFGIGFASADRIALAMGFERDGTARIEAGIKQVLLSSREEGHCYLTLGQIVTNTQELLREYIDESKLIDVVNLLRRSDQIKVRPLQNNNKETFDAYYGKKLYFDELTCSEIVQRLLQTQIHINSGPILGWVNSYCHNQQIQLSDEQLKAVCEIPRIPFAILTGGPGCGKTTCTKVLVQLLRTHLRRQVLLAAPTGRAAQRMSEVIGLEAKTIHRLLEWSPYKNGFSRDETNPLDGDFLIIDETSMLDISLASSLLKAIPPHAQVLFIGDPDQLPAVGAGNVLADLLRAPSVPRFRLSKIFRQAELSAIVRFAHEMNSGKIPEVVSPLAQPNAFVLGNDCLFIDTDTDHPWSSQKYGLGDVETILRLFTRSIPNWLGENVEVQILTPQVRGTLGTTHLNEALQKVSNPESPQKLQLEFANKIFRQGDRVIQTRNNYDLGVFNGDIGRIMDLDPEEMTCKVKFVGTDERIAQYSRENFSDLTLAYAITIHKSQGSEFPAVIIPISNQHIKMLFRNLLYTGLTRAKKLAVFVGSRKVFTQAISQIDKRLRQTALLS